MIVKQRHLYDCALAVLSMASGRSYENLFDPEFCRRIEEAKTCSGKNLDEAYSRAGFENRRSMWVLHVGLNPNYALVRAMLHGRRAMIQVPSLNYEGAEHFIYWDGERILDPSNGQIYQFMQHVFPTYVTVFDETRECKE